MSQPSNTFRRVVTSHDAEGKAVIVSNAPPLRSQRVGGPGGPTFIEVWSTRQTPALIHSWSEEPAENGLVLPSHKHGTRIR